MNKYNIGDTVFVIDFECVPETVECTRCGGDSKVKNKYGKTLTCDVCEEGNIQRYYRAYEADPTPVKLQGFRVFKGLSTKYYTEGELAADMGFLGSLIFKARSKEVLEEHVFSSLEPALATAKRLTKESQDEMFHKHFSGEYDDEY